MFIWQCTLLILMKFEYEVFESVDDLLMVAANTFSLGMRQITTLFLHGDYIMSYSPVISGEGGESMWIVSMAKGTLPVGTVEFDHETKKVQKTLKPVNPEKSYFLVIKPVKSTVLDKAMENFRIEYPSE